MRLNKEQNLRYTKCNGLIHLCCAKKENLVVVSTENRVRKSQCRECGRFHYTLDAESGKFGFQLMS